MKSSDPHLPHPVLLTDLYQLTMLQAYFDGEMRDTAVFEFFVRKLPPHRSFLMAAGLEQALDYLETLHFPAESIRWLGQTGRFSQSFLNTLEDFRFTGDVHAMPEGTIFFPNEPILRVTAPISQAQLVETRLINLLHFQTLIATKAARMVLAAPGRTLVDFGLRRAHGAEAGLLAARACYLAGMSGTATVLAETLFGVPSYGTVAHSFIQAHDDEMQAFERFARSQPQNVTLLLDTYDTEAAAHKVVALAPGLKKLGIPIKGVRLDSGDLADHARKVRKILDDGDLGEVRIFASGNIDEFTLEELTASGAPIDGFGIGSQLVTSGDAPNLDCAYKLQEYGGRPRRKRSEGKATWPGPKQVYRRFDAEDRLAGDILALESDSPSGRALLHPVMTGGKQLAPPVPLEEIRRKSKEELQHLPEGLRGLRGPAVPYAVEVSKSLKALAEAVDRGRT